MERLLILYLWWNRCEKYHSPYSDHQSGTTPRTDLSLILLIRKFSREFIFARLLLSILYACTCMWDLSAKYYAIFYCFSEGTIFANNKTREAASLIKSDLQKGDMPTRRLPDNSDAFGSLISVKPNMSTFHTKPTISGICLLCRWLVSYILSGPSTNTKLVLIYMYGHMLKKIKVGWHSNSYFL